MAKNRKKKIEIHHVLIVSDANVITNKIRARLLRGTHDKMGLLVNDPEKLKPVQGNREVVVNGKPSDQDLVTKLIQTQGFTRIYIGLSKDSAKTVESLITAMQSGNVARIVFVIRANGSQADPQINQSVDLIKGSRIPYTIIRMPQLNRNDLLSYTIVKNAQPVSDSSISSTSVADLVFQILKDPKLQKDVDLGIAQLPYK